MTIYEVLRAANVRPEHYNDAERMYYVLVYRFMSEYATDDEQWNVAQQYAIENLRELYCDLNRDSAQYIWDYLTNFADLPEDIDIFKALSDLLIFVPNYPFDLSDENWDAIYEDVADDWSEYTSPLALVSATDFVHDPWQIAGLYALLERLGYMTHEHRLDAVLDADRNPESLAHLINKVIGDNYDNRQFVVSAEAFLSFLGSPMMREYLRYHDEMIGACRDNDDAWYDSQTANAFPYSEQLFEELKDWGVHPRDARNALQDLDYAYEAYLDGENDGTLVVEMLRKILRECGEGELTFVSVAGVLAYCAIKFSSFGPSEVSVNTQVNSRGGEVTMQTNQPSLRIPEFFRNFPEDQRAKRIFKEIMHEGKVMLDAMPDAAGVIVEIIYATLREYKLDTQADALAAEYLKSKSAIDAFEKAESVS